MLSIFRRGIVSKLMLVVLGIGLVAIVVTGFGTGGTGGIGALGTGSGVASVNGESISEQELQKQVDRQLDGMRRQQPELDIVTFLKGGALEEILTQLISRLALTTFGHDNGIDASTEMVNKEIARIPLFQNFAGQFDQATMERWLQSQKLTEKELRAEIGAMLIERQIVLPVESAAKVPLSLAGPYASLLLERREGSVGLVASAAMGAGKEPTDQEVAAFYDKNQTRYIVPERRVVRYAVVAPQAVAAQAKATDAEIQADYTANQANYGPKSTRDLTQVIVPTEAAARALAAKVAGGTGIADAAKQAGFAAAVLAGQTKESFAKASAPAVADAAFAAAQGALTQPVRSGLGWHVVRVDKVSSTPGKPLAAVRGEIATRIEQRKSAAILADLSAKLDESLSGGSTFDDVVKANKLTPQETAPITATGFSPENPAYQAPAEVKAVLPVAFDMAEDDDPSVENLPQGGFAVVALGRIVPAAAPPLAQIRDRVKADFIARRAADRAKAVAQAIVSKINSGVPAAQAYSQAGVPIGTQQIAARRVDIAPKNGQVPPPLAMLFSIPRGKARLMQAPNNGGWFIVHLANVTPGDASKQPGLIEATRNEFGRALGDEYSRQFRRAVEAGMTVKRHNDRVQTLKSQLMGNRTAQ